MASFLFRTILLSCLLICSCASIRYFTKPNIAKEAIAFNGMLRSKLVKQTKLDQVQIKYNNGPLLTSQTELYLIWYGNWKNSKFPNLVKKFIASITKTPNDKKANSVKNWWATNTLYTDAKGAKVTNKVFFAKEYYSYYSNGKTFSYGLTDVEDVILRAVKNGLPSSKNGVYVVFTSEDVIVENSISGSGFCKSYCGFHDQVNLQISEKTYSIPYIFLGNPSQCPDTCMDVVEDGLVFPNNETDDTMVDTFASLLSPTFTNPGPIEGWVTSDSDDSATLCSGDYGKTLFSNKNGKPYPYTLEGIDNTRFYVQSLYNPISQACVLQTLPSNNTKNPPPRPPRSPAPAPAPSPKPSNPPKSPKFPPKPSSSKSPAPSPSPKPLNSPKSPKSPPKPSSSKSPSPAPSPKPSNPPKSPKSPSKPSSPKSPPAPAPSPKQSNPPKSPKSPPKPPSSPKSPPASAPAPAPAPAPKPSNSPPRPSPPKKSPPKKSPPPAPKKNPTPAPPSIGITYKGGRVLTNPINLYVIWYGDWNNADKLILKDLIASYSKDVNSKLASVFRWWKINTLYYNKKGTRVTNNITLKGEATSRYYGNFIIKNTITSIVDKLVSDGILTIDSNGVYVIFTSESIKVNEQNGGVFCKDYPGFHTVKQLNASVSVPFIFVGNPKTQCPNKYLTISETSPNANVGVDSMVNTFSTLLARTATCVEKGLGWVSPSGLENTELCENKFGKSFNENSPVNNLQFLYNLVGVNERKFYIQQNYNPFTGSCVLQL